jgi:hypothetical protein
MRPMPCLGDPNYTTSPHAPIKSFSIKMLRTCITLSRLFSTYKSTMPFYTKFIVPTISIIHAFPLPDYPTVFILTTQITFIGWLTKYVYFLAFFTSITIFPVILILNGPYSTLPLHRFGGPVCDVQLKPTAQNGILTHVLRYQHLNHMASCALYQKPPALGNYQYGFYHWTCPG